MSAGRVRQGGVFIEIGADPKKFFAAMNRVNQRISRLGGSLRSFGTKVSAAAAGMAVPMALAGQQFAQFDDAIRAVQAVTGTFGAKGAAAFQALTDTARELGATTSFTASEVANLMTELGRAGFDASQINNMTQAVLNLARATGTDAALSASIMAASIRQFSMTAGDATRVSDVLTVAANSTNNTVESLGEALVYAGVSAAQAGLSFEETVAILGALGNVGIQGSNAGTVLRRLVSISAAEAEKLQDIFGVEFVAPDGDVRNIVDIFRDLEQATANLPSGERIAKFNEAFGLLGVTGAQAIAGSVGNIDELNTKLENAQGAAESTAQAMDAGLGGAMRRAKSAIEGVVLQVGEALAPAFTKALDAISKIAGGLTEFAKKNAELIQRVGLITAGVLAAGLAFVAVGSAIQAAAFAAGGFLAVVGAVGAIISGIIAVVAGLGSALALAFGAIAAAGPVAAIVGVGGALTAVAAIAQSVGPALAESFNTGLANAGKVFSDLYDITSTTIGGIYDAIVNGNLSAAADILWAGLYVGWLRGQEAIMNAVDPWIAFFQNTFDYLGVEVYAIWTSMWSALTQGATTMGAVLAGIMDNVMGGIEKAWNTLAYTIERNWVFIKGLLAGGKDVTKELGELREKYGKKRAEREKRLPGVEKRMEEAQKENQKTADAAQKRIDTARANADQRASDRFDRNEANAAERRQGVEQAQANLDNLTGEQAQIRGDRSLADTLIKQLSETSDIDEYNTLLAEIERLIGEGRLTESQQNRFDTAANTGADNIAKAQEEESRKDEGRRRKSEEGAAAALGSATAGTFSTAAAALTLGGGGGAAERTAKATEDTARHTRRIAEKEGVVNN